MSILFPLLPSFLQVCRTRENAAAACEVPLTKESDFHLISSHPIPSCIVFPALKPDHYILTYNPDITNSLFFTTSNSLKSHSNEPIFILLCNSIITP